MERIGNTLFRLFRGTPNQAAWILACLEGAWSGILGERLAGVCRPASWEARHLVVAVRDEVWQGTLESMSGEILERLRDATAGEVRSVVFRVRPVEEGPAGNATAERDTG